MVLVAARLGLAGMLLAMLAAALFALALRHVLAAVHPAVAVAVGAAAVLHGMALVAGVLASLVLARLVLAMLAGLVLARRVLAMLTGLVLTVLPGLVLGVALVLGRRRGLGGGGDGEDERHRGGENLHFTSPEKRSIERENRASGEARRGRIGFGVKAVKVRGE